MMTPPEKMNTDDRKLFDLIEETPYFKRLKGYAVVKVPMKRLNDCVPKNPGYDTHHAYLFTLQVGETTINLYQSEFGGGSEQYMFEISDRDDDAYQNRLPYDSLRMCFNAAIKLAVRIEDEAYEESLHEDDEDDDNPDFEDFVRVASANHDLAETITLLKAEINNAQQSLNQKIVFGSKVLDLIQRLMRLLTKTSQTHAERNEDMLKALAICIEATDILRDMQVFYGVPKDTPPF